MDWLTWGNAAYLIAIVIGGLATLVAKKYRPALKELKEVIKLLHGNEKQVKILKVDLMLKEEHLQKDKAVT